MGNNQEMKITQCLKKILVIFETEANMQNNVGFVFFVVILHRPVAYKINHILVFLLYVLLQYCKHFVSYNVQYPVFRDYLDNLSTFSSDFHFDNFTSLYCLRGM